MRPRPRRQTGHVEREAIRRSRIQWREIPNILDRFAGSISLRPRRSGTLDAPDQFVLAAQQTNRNKACAPPHGDVAVLLESLAVVGVFIRSGIGEDEIARPGGATSRWFRARRRAPSRPAAIPPPGPARGWSRQPQDRIVDPVIVDDGGIDQPGKGAGDRQLADAGEADETDDQAIFSGHLGKSSVHVRTY